jgi:transcriptional regulator of acetoin/glycerol metabolism
MLGEPLSEAGAVPVPDAFARLQPLPYGDAKEVVLKEFSNAYLRAAITQAQGNISQAARACGLERQAVQRLLRRYRIDISDLRDGGSR